MNATTDAKARSKGKISLREKPFFSILIKDGLHSEFSSSYLAMQFIW